MKHFPRNIGMAAGRVIKRFTPPSLLFVASLFTLLGCVDEPVRETRWEIQSEPFASNGSKMAIQGRVAEWVAGDDIKINNTTATVSLSDGKAYLSGDVLEANVYRAVYPASIVTGNATLSEDEVTVTLPSTYTYREDADGKQVLDLPMAAAAKEFPLKFKHLTAGIVVNVTNDVTITNQNSDTKLYVTKIIVSSNKYSLSGERILDVTTADIGVKTSQGMDTMLTLTLTSSPVGIERNQSKSFMIPVPPVGGDNVYSVTVMGYALRGNTALHVSLGNTMRQEVGGALLRNKLAHAPITVSGTSHISVEEVRIDGDNVYVSTTTGMERVIDSLRNRTAWRTKNIIMEDDIELSSTENGFKPITNFAGTLDGGGHTLSGISFVSSIISSKVHLGFFTNPSGDVTIKNLTLDYSSKSGQSFSSTYSTIYVGFLCAYTAHNVIVENVIMSRKLTTIAQNMTQSTSTSANYYFGGMIGYVDGNVSITSSQSGWNAYRYTVGYGNGDNRGTLYMGQLVGYLDGTHTANVIDVSVKNAPLQGKGYSSLKAGKFIADKDNAASWTFTNSTSTSSIYNKNGTSILSTLSH